VHIPSSAGNLVGLKVDSHHHFWDLTRFHYDWMPSGESILKRNYTPEDIIPLLHKSMIDRTVVVQAHESLEEANWILDLADENAFIAGVVCWVDLVDPKLCSVLDDLMARPKFVGIRHGVEHDEDQEWLTRESSRNGLKELAARGIPYDVLIRPHQIKQIPFLADQIPDLKMVIDHISKPSIASGQMEPWATDITEIAEIPGIYCKISGMVTEADHNRWRLRDFKPYVDHIMDIFGFDKLMFGSDWPVCLLASTYDDVVKVALGTVGEISVSDRDKLMGQNAIDFYGLNVS
jgi:L-fuconolactonase